MTITEAPTTIHLSRASLGTTFEFRGENYILTSFRQTKAEITRLSDKKKLVLGISAPIKPTGRDMSLLGEILADGAPQLNKGQRVRIIDNARTRKQGVAGVESVIVRVSQKSYSLANDWRVSFNMVEAI